MSEWKEYKVSGQLAKTDVGFTFGVTGRFPIIGRRIWGTLNDAQGFIDDTSTQSTACEGLIFSVVNDGTNNGVYFVKSIGDGTNPGVLEKLGGSADIENLQEALAELQKAVGASGSTEITNALSGDTYVSGSTSVIDALNKVDAELVNIENNIKKANVTAATWNSVTGTITHSADGTSIALTADTSDINIADDFVTTTYQTELSAATPIAVDDTVSTAFNKVETTISALTQEVLDDEEVNAAAIKALGEAAGTIDNDDVIAYIPNTSAQYISGATNLAEADDLLNNAIQNLQTNSLEEVEAGDGISVSTKADNKQTITAVAKTNDPVIEVTSNGIGTKEDAVFDCGTYEV